MRPIGKLWFSHSNRESGRYCSKGGAWQYLPTGHIVYALANNNISNLFAVPLISTGLRSQVDLFPYLKGIRCCCRLRFRNAGLCPTASGCRRICECSLRLDALWYGWTDREKKNRLEPHPMLYYTLKISPDGTRVALTIVHWRELRHLDLGHRSQNHDAADL